MIQDIAPYKLYNEYRPQAKPEDESRVLCCFEKYVLIRLKTEEKSAEFPRLSELPVIDPEELVYAFSVDETPYFLYIGKEQQKADAYEYANIHNIRHLLSNVFGMIIYTGIHLHHWYNSSKFCGCCGQKLQHSKRERAMCCPDCGKTFYPRLNPAVIVGVTDGDKILVTKYKSGFAHFALVAGFTEIGETLEETVMREVMEETGLCVKNIRYYKSQPWGMADDILVGFYCDVDGDRTIRIDEQELKIAEWKERAEIELQPDDYSLTNEMMQCFKENKEIK